MFTLIFNLKFNEKTVNQNNILSKTLSQNTEYDFSPKETESCRYAAMASAVSLVSMDWAMARMLAAIVSVAL